MDDTTHIAISATGYRVWLADELWLCIFGQLDMDDLFTLTKVSTHFRALANDMATPRDIFLFNLRRDIRPVHDTMPATRAKFEFLLTDADLAKLPCEHIRNPRFRTLAPMKLYRILDLETTTLTKYGNWTTFVAQRDRRYHTTKMRVTTIQKNRDARRQALALALSVYGLGVRADSQMCHHFITHGHGIHGENIDDIVNIMREMSFLHTNTNYCKWLETIKTRFRHDHIDYTIEEVVHCAKTMAIREWWRKHRANYSICDI